MITEEERTHQMEERICELEAAYMELGKRNEELSAENAMFRNRALKRACELDDAKKQIHRLEVKVIRLKAKLYDKMVEDEK